MRIAIIGPCFDDCLEFHLKQTFQAMGHDAQTFSLDQVIPLIRNRFFGKSYEYLAYVREGVVKAHHRKLAEAILAFAPDLVIGTDRQVHSECVNHIKDRKPDLPAIQLNPDQLTTFGRQHIFLARYDAYFTKDRFIQRFMQDKLGLRTYYLPECFNPAFHTIPDCSKEEAEARTGIDVMAMGGMYPYRAKFLERVLQAGINLTIFGRAFDYFTGEWSRAFRDEFITGARKAELIYGSKIVLNNMHYAEVEAVNCKFFEIMGAAGCQVCDDKPVVPELALQGHEVVTFNSVDECVEKIKHLLDHPAERYSIAEAARKRALAEHTYQHRLQEMLGNISDLVSV
jgi:spore maturation protein CgeB